MSDEAIHKTTNNGENNVDVEMATTAEELKELRLLRHLRTLKPVDYEAQHFDNKPDPRGDAYRKMGNPSALGILVLAVTNTMIALFLMQVRGIEHSNVLVGVLWFTGGIASSLTAALELLLGNTFAWCVFGSFAGYYFAFASVLTPSFGVTAAYTNPTELNDAMGVFFCVWASLFLIFLIASLKTNLIFVWIFVLVDMTTWLLAASYFQAAAGNMMTALKLQKASGGFLFACSMGGWYLLVIQLTESLAFGFKLPIGSLGPAGKEIKVRKHSQDGNRIPLTA